MFKLHKTIPFAIICGVSLMSGAGPAAAEGYLAKNGMVVNKVNSHTIEVVARSAVSKNAYWCAAGDYVHRQLGLPWDTRLYVVSDISPAVTENATSAVQFTVDPAAAGVTPFEGSYISNATGVGVNRDITYAWNKCSGKRR